MEDQLTVVSLTHERRECWFVLLGAVTACDTDVTNRCRVI